MAGRPAPESSAHRSSCERRFAQRAAAAAASRGMARLRQELEDTTRRLGTLAAILGLADTGCDILDRLLAIAPALRDLLLGVQPKDVDILRRNVALHAAAVEGTFSSASVAQLRVAQKGPRLGGPRVGLAPSPRP